MTCLDGILGRHNVGIDRQPVHAAATERPEASVDVDLNGVYVGAHAAGTTIREAVDRMQDKLRARLARR